MNESLYSIKLSGSGTLEELSDHLLQLSQSIDNYAQVEGWQSKTFEDPYICAEIEAE